jgi:hypothetical protein
LKTLGFLVPATPSKRISFVDTVQLEHTDKPLVAGHAPLERVSDQLAEAA